MDKIKKIFSKTWVKCTLTGVICLFVGVGIGGSTNSSGEKTQTVSTNTTKQEQPTENKEVKKPETQKETTLPATQEQKKISVTINKVEQDANSLKVYVNYKNDTGAEISTTQSLAKIVCDGKQEDYDSDFNFNNYYNKGIAHAPDSLENSVSADTVLFFKPVEGDKINIVINCNYTDFRFNNVPVTKK